MPDKEDCPKSARSPGADPQLVRREEGDLQWYRGWPEPQRETRHQKSARLSHVRSPRNRRPSARSSRATWFGFATTGGDGGSFTTRLTSFGCVLKPIGLSNSATGKPVSPTPFWLNSLLAVTKNTPTYVGVFLVDHP